MQRAWLPVLPGIAVAVLLAWGNCLFDVAISEAFRRALSLAAAGYLLTLAGFTFFGRRSAPLDSHARAAASLAVGLGLTFLNYWSSAWLPASSVVGTLPGSGSDPLSPVNAMAAVLAVVLAVVTLIAQKSASDARMEAEKARNDILGAMDIRLLAESIRLLALAQDASSTAGDWFAEANSIAQANESRAKWLSATAYALNRLRKFLSAISLWSHEPGVVSGQEVADTLNLLGLDLDAMERLSSGVGRLDDRHRALRLQFWHPVARTLEKLLISLQFQTSSSTVSTTELLIQIRVLRQRLNTL